MQGMRNIGFIDRVANELAVVQLLLKPVAGGGFARSGQPINHNQLRNSRRFH
jgi:hypothetical protein